MITILLFLFMQIISSSNDGTPIVTLTTEDGQNVLDLIDHSDSSSSQQQENEMVSFFFFFKIVAVTVNRLHHIIVLSRERERVRESRCQIAEAICFSNLF